jgi:hypothetical protein
MCYVKDSNRELLQDRYIDSIIMNLDFMQVRDLLGVYLNSEKTNYSNEELDDEIKARGLWRTVCEPVAQMEMSLLKENQEEQEITYV